MFDLDDTLAESFQPPTPQMLELFGQLLEKIPLAIITAAGLPRIERDFLVPLAHHPKLSQLTIFPDSSTRCYLYKEGQWKQEYALTLSEEDRIKIKDAIGRAIAETGVLGVEGYDPLIIDREAQVAYTFLGLDAPDPIKRSWDPDFKKRIAVRERLLKDIPEYDIFIGGRSTIDITSKGVNKSYGVKWLSDRMKIHPQEMLFVGDALYEGGNDVVVIKTGIETRSVTGPQDTLGVIQEVLAACSAPNL